MNPKYKLLTYTVAAAAGGLLLGVMLMALAAPMLYPVEFTGSINSDEAAEALYARLYGDVSGSIEVQG